MKSTCVSLLTALALTLLLAATAAAQAQPSAAQNEEANIKAYIELMRKDVKKDKVAIITEMMELGPDEAAKFWPVYNEYDKELTKLGDERIALIRRYAENYSSMTDQKALELSTQVLDLEGRRTVLKRKYLQQMSKTLSGKLAARFMQVEGQLERVIDLQIASSLPVVQ